MSEQTDARATLDAVIEEVRRDMALADRVVQLTVWRVENGTLRAAVMSTLVPGLIWHKARGRVTRLLQAQAKARFGNGGYIVKAKVFRI